MSKLNLTREEYEDMFVDILPPNTNYEEVVKDANDPVNHPSHYTYGKIETIDFITDKGLDFCRGNAIKYIIRAGKKEGTNWQEDIQKAIWYLNYYRQHSDTED